MKNIKVLLATSAILSTAALMVNAAVDDETVVPVRAEVVLVHNLHATPIDFGRIGVDDEERNENDWLMFSLNSAGIETYYEGSTIPGYILSNGKKGVVKGTDCEHLDIGSEYASVSMSIPISAVESNIEAHANIKCITVDSDATFYGEFFLTAKNGSYIPAGNYTGNLTVTEINPEP